MMVDIGLYKILRLGAIRGQMKQTILHFFVQPPDWYILGLRASLIKEIDTAVIPLDGCF